MFAEESLALHNHGVGSILHGEANRFSHPRTWGVTLGKSLLSGPEHVK
jgi:hypothetical protein